MLGTHPCPRLSPGPGAVLTCPGGEGGGDGGLLRVAGSERHHVLGVGAQVAQRGRLRAGPQALLFPLGCPWRGRWRGKGGHGGTARAGPGREGVSAGPHLAPGMPVGARGGERWERLGWRPGQGHPSERPGPGRGFQVRGSSPAPGWDGGLPPTPHAEQPQGHARACALSPGQGHPWGPPAVTHTRASASSPARQSLRAWEHTRRLHASVRTRAPQPAHERPAAAVRAGVHAPTALLACTPRITLMHAIPFPEHAPCHVLPAPRGCAKVGHPDRTTRWRGKYPHLARCS